MIQNTLDRMTPVIPPENAWVITNENHALETCRQLKAMEFCPSRLLTEPVGRNTAAAIGYSASILSKIDPDAIMAIFGIPFPMVVRISILLSRPLSPLPR